MEIECDIFICIVLYNKKLEESSTFKSLLLNRDIPPTSLFVYDNSLTADEGISTVDNSNFEIEYFHDATNPGVSKAYNIAAAKAKSKNKKWLFFFDDDTTVSNTYFESFIHAQEQFNNIKLFCPKTIANNKLLSPSSYFFERSFIKSSISAGIHKTKNLTLINSGIIISLDAFYAVGEYDEKNFPLDYSDHDFFKRLKKLYKEFYVLPCVNTHNFSTYNNISKEAVYKRFTIYYSAARLFSKKYKSPQAMLWSFLRALKLSIQFKSFVFLKYASTLFKK